jgi:GT2 family glycosyltransferase
MISVILVQHNGFGLTSRALESLWSWGKERLEVILVDNASDGFVLTNWQRWWPGVKFIANAKNKGFGAANNQGVKQSRGDILFFLNTDTEVWTPFADEVERRFQENPRLGIIGPRLLYPDGSFQLSAGELPSIGQEARDKFTALREREHAYREKLALEFSRMRPVGWVTGAALFMRRSAFEAVGGYDERMFMFFEDKDLCLRAAKASFEVVYDPEITLMHVKGGSSVGEMSEGAAKAYRESQRLYYAKHLPDWQQKVLSVYLGMRGK